ncbi:hypothetical protein [Candidatus Palauibacter sp.]|uniref:hypothetical protein n=1 Tax=Candidatus Palauibacter sp. TaxID=3101350 RepID=UPI003B526743
MISNYDRIYREIQIEARRIGEDLDVDHEILERLTLEIVDFEDRHRISRVYDIAKQVQAMIENTAITAAGEASST